MKRGVQSATGIIVLLAIIFFAGLVVNDNALAVGSGITGVDKPKDISSITDAKTASTSTTIKKNTTLSSTKTYNSNVIVNPGVTLTIKGGTITINGDLVIGGAMPITGGKLVVNDDIWVYGTMTAGGSSTITVNKAPKVLHSGSYYYYG